MPKGQIIDDAELPITFVPIVGPGVDAFNNRKETSSPVCLEGEVNERLRAYGRSPLGKKNMAALADFIRRWRG